MALKKQELNHMAAELRTAVIDLRHRHSREEETIRRIEKVMEELLIQAHICRE